MREETILKVYELIGLDIHNKKGYNSKIVSRLYSNFFLEPESLIQDVIVSFLSMVRDDKINEIENIKKFVSIFTRNYLLDVEREMSTQTRISRGRLDVYRDDVSILPKPITVGGNTVHKPEPVVHIDIKTYEAEIKKQLIK